MIVFPTIASPVTIFKFSISYRNNSKSLLYISTRETVPAISKISELPSSVSSVSSKKQEQHTFLKAAWS